MQSRVATFLWNSSEFRFGAYAVSVEVTAVKGEKAVEDNMLSGMWIRVVLAGDVDANDFVNIRCRQRGIPLQRNKRGL